MKIVRKQLAPLVSYAFPTRYDEATNTVEMSPDGGTTWQPFPEGDPRLNNHVPPPDTTDPRCDAAARIRAATEAEATAVIAQVDQAATVLPVVTGFFRLFTPMFTYIPYLSIAYSLIQAILSIGSVALHAAFDGFDWDAFECMIFKSMGGDGQLSDDGFNQLLTDIANTYSDATETLLYNFYYLAGRAGLNDQAGLRTETGDCSACPNTWSHTLYADDPRLSWSFPFEYLTLCNGTNVDFGQRGATVEYGGNLIWHSPANQIILGGQIHIPDGCTLTSVVLNAFTYSGGGNYDNWMKWRQMWNIVNCYGAFYTGFNRWDGSAVGPATFEWLIRWFKWGGSVNDIGINGITISGTGVDPFV